MVLTDSEVDDVAVNTVGSLVHVVSKGKADQGHRCLIVCSLSSLGQLQVQGHVDLVVVVPWCATCVPCCLNPLLF